MTAAASEEPADGGAPAEKPGVTLGDLAITPPNPHFVRGYGPLAVGFALFVLMALLAPTVVAERDVTVEGLVAGGRFGGNNSALVTGDGGDGGGDGDGGGGGASGAITDPELAGGTGGGEQVGTYVPPRAAPCTDRAEAIPGDPYSPPCYAFSGDNGGATSRGVSADEVVIAIRLLDGPSAAEIFADISGASVNDSPEAIKDTYLALADYFNEKMQFYGRKIRLEIFTGQGNGANELLGGGQEQAKSDAVRVAQEIKAFGEANAVTIPYADALANEEVVGLGAPYPSRAWFEKRKPYAWSLFPDGTVVVESTFEFLAKRIAGGKAEHAGGDLRGKPRTFAVVAPENAEYQESVNAFVDLAEKNGIKIAANLKYRLDLNSMPNQASARVAQLKDKKITSVLCACDPVMLALGMGPKAVEQGYDPEWITSGLAFVDQDIVGQLIDERQWKRAFGIAYSTQSVPLGNNIAYAAYKSVRPDDEPAFGVEVLYYQMYMAALGIHMAGPDLTPQTFEAGMFGYPGGQGPIGRWGFGPGDYTPTDDYREIWWNPEKVSPQNNAPGTWVTLNDGARYLPGGLPQGKAPFFGGGD